MRFSVARSRCRFSSFSARSEPGGLCLLLAAAAPAAPVEEPVEVVFCSPLRVSMADRVCCCGSRREPAISKAAVAPPAHVHAGQSERSTGLDCPELKRVSCAQLDRNGEVETIAHLESERPPQRPSLCGAAAQRRIPVAARTRRPASHRTRGARTSVLCRACRQRANETAQNGTSRRALLARGDWSYACTTQLVNRSTGLACPKLTRIACAH